MTDLDGIQYKNGAKNNWRRQMWNTVREFTDNPSDAMVLYLPGAANLDVPVAISKGFKQANMLAVEREGKVVEHLRRKYRQPVIHGSLAHTLIGWPQNRPVAVIVADLVSGFDGLVTDIVRAWMLLQPFEGATLVLNMQRGRESDCTKKHTVMWQHHGIVQSLAERWGVSSNSRALYTMFSMPMFLQWHYVRCVDAAGESLTDHDKALLMEQALANGTYWTWRFLPPYRSGRVVMDSLVIKDLGKIQGRTYLLAGSDAPNKPVKIARAMRRKVAAAFAVRTMRLS